MRKLLALAAFVLPLSLFTIPTPAAAQYVYGISSILLDTELDHAYGYSATLLDYEACYYYDAGVVGTLREEPFTDLASYGVRGVCSAEVYTDGPAQENRVYTEYSDHYLFAVYYLYYYGGWYDPFGYGFLGGGDHGGNFSFFGCYYCYNFFAQTQQDLGSTEASLLNPEDVCNKTPTLSGPSEVTRAQSAEFKLDNLCPGAQISGWKFTDSSGNVVSRTTQTSAASWEGPIVTDGMVQVTVKQRSDLAPVDLSRAIAVKARQGFGFQPRPATKFVNREFHCGPNEISVPDNPMFGYPNDILGIFTVCHRASFDGEILGQGPNTGYFYVTEVRDSDSSKNPPQTTVAWVLSPPLENPASAFYRAQCGDYDADIGEGFISAERLISNIIGHEVTDSNSHYARYIEALGSHNPGVSAEAVVGKPGLPNEQYKGMVASAIVTTINTLDQARSGERCSNKPECLGEANCDATCTYYGETNFPPFEPCSTPLPPPPPTTAVGASSTPTQVNLSWADTSSNELGFKIDRSSAGGGFVEIGSVGPNVTTYADTTVVAGSTYAYQVRAWNSGGSSAPSASVTVAVPTAVTGTPPAAPCCLWSPSSYSWTGRVDIEWLDLSNNEQGFTIERSENWGGWFAPVGWVGANSTSWQDFDWLQAGSTYIYRVVATNDAGSATSDELAVTVPLWTY